MPVDADGELDSSDKRCKICNEVTSKNRSVLKCNSVKCNVVVHGKCFDLVTKVFHADKKTWRCKSCCETVKGQCCNSSFDLKIFQKENECLMREKDILNKRVCDLEYIVDLQKSNMQIDKNMHTSAAEGVKDNVSYSQAVKNTINKTPAVLLIKCNDKSVLNTKIEKDVKTAVNPGSLDINISSTKLIKNGLLINCEDEGSLDKLRENLNKK